MIRVALPMYLVLRLGDAELMLFHSITGVIGFLALASVGKFVDFYENIYRVLFIYILVTSQTLILVS